jgi:Predicted flavin-nucleotide-binding protein
VTAPLTDPDPRYGEPGAPPTEWAEAERILATAELYWISTVRPDGRPHVTPLLAVWDDGALHVCTGAAERKARNIAANPRVALTTGRNDLVGGTDVVVECVAHRVTDPARLAELATAWEKKYGADWHFDVGAEGFTGPGGVAWVFRLDPTTAFAFGKGPYRQTRYRFT